MIDNVLLLLVSNLHLFISDHELLRDPNIHHYIPGKTLYNFKWSNNNEM